MKYENNKMTPDEMFKIEGYIKDVDVTGKIISYHHPKRQLTIIFNLNFENYYRLKTNCGHIDIFMDDNRLIQAKLNELGFIKKIKSLNDWAKEIHETAVEKGWWAEERKFGEIISLCHSELSEALEEYRDGNPGAYFIQVDDKLASFGVWDSDVVEEMSLIKENKPEGIFVELIDCIIRILDYLGAENVDVDSILEIKHAYNKTRGHRHGGKLL